MRRAAVRARRERGAVQVDGDDEARGKVCTHAPPAPCLCMCLLVCPAHVPVPMTAVPVPVTGGAAARSFYPAELAYAAIDALTGMPCACVRGMCGMRC